MTLKLGFLGCGLIARSHASRLVNLPEATIHCVYDVDEARSQAFASDMEATAGVSVEQVIEQCDAIYITTWTSEHPLLVSLVTAAGKPVFCEKPLGIDLASAQAMFDDVEASGVTNQVGLILRHSPSFRWMQHHMSSGEYGPRMSMVFRDDQFIPIQGMYGSTWRSDVERAGAGTLLEHSIHDLDLIEWILGPIARIGCVTSNTHGIEGIEDQATVMLTAASGASGVLSSTWHDVMTRPSLRHVEGFCQNGYFEVAGDWTGPVTLASGEDPEQTWAGGDVAKMAKAIDDRRMNPDIDFVENVLNERPAYPDFSVALRAHVLADAAYTSAANNGAPVEV